MAYKLIGRILVKLHSKQRQLLEELLYAGINSVSGEASVRNFFLTNGTSRPDRILAIGKASCSMYNGLPEDIKTDVPALIITKEDHVPKGLVNSPTLTVIESSHPLPTQTSLKAGQSAVNFVSEMNESSNLLILASGGASALAEHLKEGYDLNDLFSLNKQCLASGDDIATINEKRARLSDIKQGGLLSFFKGHSVKVLAISDVQGDSISVIGSGIAAKGVTTKDYRSHIVASNEVARGAIAAAATKQGLFIAENKECLYSDIEVVANNIYNAVNHGRTGLYIYGGEPTIKLPDNHGKGGRNQALALSLARRISNHADLFCLVAGTDGTDGPTRAAGGYADGRTYIKPKADEAIKSANSAAFLEQIGHQFVTGPTGTNVMDIALILKT